MTTGELVLPEVMVGMMEASMTRKRSMPRTRSRESTTAPGSSARPILQVLTGWKMVVPTSPAALTSSSSDWKAGPGMNSCGSYFASERVSVTRLRAMRNDLAAIA